MVFHDKTLREVAIFRPQRPTTVLQITGIGEQKLERYGDRFLDVIKESTGNTADGQAKGLSDVKRKTKPQRSKKPSHAQKEQVIQLLKKGRLDSNQIAEMVGISPLTV